MNEIELYVKKLPDTMEDLSRFVFVGREKYNSVRAEIRAMEKLKLVDEVLKQKRAEASMLSDVILEAEVRLGDLFKLIPKKQGKRTDMELGDSGVPKSEQSKVEIIEGLGFSKKQAQRLETLANNTDLVQQVKDEARENGEFPTKARILELAAQKNNQENENSDPGDNSETTRIIYMEDSQAQDEEEMDEYYRFLDLRAKVYKELAKINELIIGFEITPHRMDALRDNFDAVIRVEEEIGYLNDAITKLNTIKSEIRKGYRHEKRK